LRLEKGHIIISQDTDGLTTPLEVGLQWALKMDKAFFIGQRSLKVIAEKVQKQQLIGFELDQNFTGQAPMECHLIIDQGEISGRVTSIAWSPTLERYIGMAFIRPDLAQNGNKIAIRLSDKSIVQAMVVKTPFYDPENLQQKESAK
jgi:sarcosine oxidase subunit alpha